MTGRRLRISTEIYNVNGGGVSYEDVPAEWDDWTPAQREAHRDALFAEALAEVAGGGVALVDAEGNELNDDGTRA